MILIAELNPPYDVGMNEPTITSEVRYHGPKFQLRSETVQGPNGIAQRDIIDHPPAVGILPVDLDGNIYLVRQYRKAIEAPLIEIPAGCMDDGEAPLTAAHRELKEETGLIANKLESLGNMWMAPGFCNEYMHLFLATQLQQSTVDFDEDEYLECLRYPINVIIEMIAKKEIKDAKTILAIQAYRLKGSGGL